MSEHWIIPLGLLIPEFSPPTLQVSISRARQFDPALDDLLRAIAQPRPEPEFSSFLALDERGFTVAGLLESGLILRVPAWGDDPGPLADLTLWPIARAKSWHGDAAVELEGALGAGITSGVVMWAILRADGAPLRDHVATFAQGTGTDDEQLVWNTLYRHLVPAIRDRVAFLGEPE